METGNVRSNGKTRTGLVVSLIILAVFLVGFGVVAVISALGNRAAPAVLTQDLSEPLGSATSAKIDINRYSGNLTIDRLSSGEKVLASGSLPYQDNQVLERSANLSGGQAVLLLKTSAGKPSGFRFPWEVCADDTEWQIHLNPGVPSDINAYSGGGNLKLNLAGTAVTGVVASTGGGNVDVVLPENAANLGVVAKSGAGNVNVVVGSGLTGSSTLNADSGAGNVVVRLPSGVAARIHTTSGLGKAIVDAQFSKIDEATYESPNYSSAADKIEITAKSGAGNVSIMVE